MLGRQPVLLCAGHECVVDTWIARSQPLLKSSVHGTKHVHSVGLVAKVVAVLFIRFLQPLDLLRIFTGFRLLRANLVL